METEVKPPEEALKAAVEEVQAPEKKEPEKHEPPEGGKRWNEVYGKMKNLERTLAEKDKAFNETLAGIQEHNRKLAEAVSKIEDGIEDQNRPDPTIDPEAYEKYLEGKLKRKLEKVRQEDKPVVKKAESAPQDVQKIQEQADAMAELYDDYEDVLKEVMPKIKDDQALADKIFKAKNPPAAMYKYGLELRQKKEERAVALEQGYVEGGTKPAPKDDIQLSPIQERVRQGLGLSKEAYIAQLKLTGARP